jgi:hypothetical protein
MNAGYPLRPFLVPAILAAATAFALLAALLSDGALEVVAVATLAVVVGLVAVKLLWRRKSR